MIDHSAPPARRLLPLLIVATLLLEVVVVYSVERWLLRTGLSPAATHAQRSIKQEVDARFQQGVLMLHAKQFDHALTAFHRVLQLSPRLPEAHVNMGYALLGKGSYKEAADFFRGALTLRPAQVNAYYGLALALDGAGQRQEALEAMHLYLMGTAVEDAHREKAETVLRTWRDEMDSTTASAAPSPRKVGAGGTAQ